MPRTPVATRFYPGSVPEQIREFLANYQPPAHPSQPVAGIVPHAGWTYSGAVAAKVFACLQAVEPETFVIFGAVHSWGVGAGGVYDKGSWRTSAGDVEVDDELAARLIASCRSLHPDAEAHENEHSIEVQLPMIKFLFPNSKIVPISAPPVPDMVDIGSCVGAALAKESRRCAVIGSTDLTHYGRNYGFAPWGEGADAYNRMRENDRRIINLALSLDADAIIAESQKNFNACGGGALAAAVAAAKAMGAQTGALVQYTTSHDVSGERADEFDFAVGYAGILLGRD